MLIISNFGLQHSYLVGIAVMWSFLLLSIFVVLSLLGLGRITECNKNGSVKIDKKKPKYFELVGSYKLKQCSLIKIPINNINLHISGCLQAALQDWAAPHAILVLTIRVVTITNELGEAFKLFPSCVRYTLWST